MKLHLGCWHRHLPGFTHVDLCDLPHIDYKTSVDDLHMIEDRAAELIYASHVFEYFDAVHAPRVLAEWHRVLKPGGTLRMAVPDFDALIHVYQHTGKLENILGPLYGRMVVKGLGGTQIIFHKTVYNFERLRNLMESSGFGDVRRYDWRTTIHKDFDDHSQAYFPHMDKEHGTLVSLNVEATKA